MSSFQSRIPNHLMVMYYHHSTLIQPLPNSSALIQFTFLYLLKIKPLRQLVKLLLMPRHLQFAWQPASISDSRPSGHQTDHSFSLSFTKSHRMDLNFCLEKT